MEYQNISVDKLDAALNKIDDISYKQVSNLRNSISSNDWQSPVRMNIDKALSEIVSEYEVIKTDLDKCKTISRLIKSYKNQEEEYKKYTAKVNKYKELYERYKYKTNLDSNEEYWKQYYKNKYNDYANKKDTSSYEKNSIKNKINSEMEKLK